MVEGVFDFECRHDFNGAVAFVRELLSLDDVQPRELLEKSLG
jgi:hypothetical protein